MGNRERRMTESSDAISTHISNPDDVKSIDSRDSTTIDTPRGDTLPMEKLQKPAPKQLNALYPIDAKLLQYYYMSAKIKWFSLKVSNMMTAMKSNNELLIDPQTTILLSGPIFNINDNFYRRCELLQNCQKYNPGQQLNNPLMLSPISFDSFETISRNAPVGPYGIPFNKLVPFPDRKKFLETFALLELLLNSVAEVLNKRLSTAIREYHHQHNLDETKESWDVKFNDFKFNEFSLVENFNFTKIPNIPITKQESVLKYYLDNQFKFLESICAFFQNLIDEISAKSQEVISSITKSRLNKRVRPSEFVYKMYFLLLRISDIYIQIRKVGKTVYFQSINYFQPYSRQKKSLLDNLSKMKSYFSQSKQNGILISLISKYAKRTEIKNVSLDFNIFTSEFRKTSSEMISLVLSMIKCMEGLHDEWTMLVLEGKDNDFNKEYLREKLKERVAKDREKRISMLLENQKELKTKMENQRAGCISPSDMNYTNIKFTTQRVTSMDSINEQVNELHQPQPSINGDPNTAAKPPTGNRRVVSAASSAAAKIQRLSKVGSSSAPSSARNSLTGSSRSPFYRSPSNSSSKSSQDSLLDTLIRTDTARNIGTRFETGVKLNGQSKISEVLSTDEGAEVFKEPTPNFVPHRKSSAESSPSSISLSPSRSPVLNTNSTESSPSLTRTSSIRLSSLNGANNLKSASVSNSRLNSLTSSPSGVPTNLGRTRFSTQPQLSSTATARQQKQYVISSPNPQSSTSSPNIKTAAAMTAHRNSQNQLSPQHLTAQQRLQQHILKAAQNGSVYGKPLERRTSVIIRNKPKDTEPALGVNPNLQITPSSPISFDEIIIPEEIENDEKDDVIDMSINLEAENPIHSLNGAEIEESENSLTEFPSSPLNSLKGKSLEAHNALKQKLINMSRSNSNNTTRDSLNMTSENVLISPVGRRVSPLKNHFASSSTSSLGSPSHSQSPTRIRSRSNSSTVALSRRNSTASSRGVRTRSNSNVNYGGNTAVVSSPEEGIKYDMNGEVIKKLRFIGINEYSEDEDAPTPMRMQKQIRQKWAAYKPLFRKLNSQEGMALKQNYVDEQHNVDTAISGMLTTLRDDSTTTVTPMSSKSLRPQVQSHYLDHNSHPHTATTAAFNSLSNSIANSENGNSATGSTNGNNATKRLSRLFSRKW